MELVYVANDNAFELTIKDVNGDPVNSNVTASVTTIADDDGGEIAGVVFPITFTYVAASAGVWRCTLPKEAELSANAFYTAFIDVHAVTQDLESHHEVQFIARTRRHN